MSGTDSGDGPVDVEQHRHQQRRGQDADDGKPAPDEPAVEPGQRRGSGSGPGIGRIGMRPAHLRSIQ
jgi:hypothetical protein